MIPRDPEQDLPLSPLHVSTSLLLAHDTIVLERQGPGFPSMTCILLALITPSLSPVSTLRSKPLQAGRLSYLLRAPGIILASVRKLISVVYT